MEEVLQRSVYWHISVVVGTAVAIEMVAFEERSHPGTFSQVRRYLNYDITCVIQWIMTISWYGFKGFYCILAKKKVGIGFANRHYKFSEKCEHYTAVFFQPVHLDGKNDPFLWLTRVLFNERLTKKNGR